MVMVQKRAVSHEIPKVRPLTCELQLSCSSLDLENTTGEKSAFYFCFLSFLHMRRLGRLSTAGRLNQRKKWMCSVCALTNRETIFTPFSPFWKTARAWTDIEINVIRVFFFSVGPAHYDCWCRWEIDEMRVMVEDKFDAKNFKSTSTLSKAVVLFLDLRFLIRT